MAVDLVYIYKLKDQFSKKLDSIAKKQLQFTRTYTKSMGKVNATAIKHQKIIDSTSRTYNKNKQALSRLNLGVDKFNSSVVKNNTSLLRNNRLLSIQKRKSEPLSIKKGIKDGLGRSFLRNLNETQDRISRINGGLFNMRNAITAAGSAWVASKILQLPLGQAAFLEDQLISYKVLLGGNEKAAQKLVSTLNKIGAETPFEFSHLSNATNMMLGLGAATQENVIDKLKMIGDIAQGDPMRLKMITFAFSQIHSLGKATGLDMNQLANAGVPMKELAKGLGITVKKMRKLQGMGKLTPAMIEQGFKSMTSEGGLFYKMMEQKSKTLTGKISTLKDNINLTAQAIGAGMLPPAKELVNELIRISGRVQDWAKNNKDLIATKVGFWFRKIIDLVKWGEENFTLLLNVTKLLTIGVGGLVTANLLLKTTLNAIWVSTKLWTAAQWLLNAALTANPISLIVVGIAAFIAMVVVGIKKTSSLTESFKIMGGILIKSFVTPINLAIAGVSKLLNIFGASDLSAKINAFQDKANLVLTGNKSLTAVGMGYDLFTKDKGSEISSWVSDSSDKAISSKNKTMDHNIMLNGKIGVEAAEGTKVNYSNLDFLNAGNNLTFGM